MTPHPQRCETCKNTECLFNPNAEEDWRSFSQESTWKFTSLLGCASHSNSSKVLDLLIRVYANLAHTYTEESDFVHWNLVRDTKKMIAQLRKQEGQR